MLESTGIWWRETMSTRKNNPKTSSRVAIGQRVNDLDLSAIYMEMTNPVHLCLPAEYEGSKTVTSIGWSDPRTEIGELLWPKRFTKEILNELKENLGSYGTAAQLQQSPVPRGGGIIKENWLKRFVLARDIHSRLILTKFKFICQSWDTAFKEGEENDYSVCLTLGVAPDGFYAINRWKGRVDFPELEKISIELANIYNPNQILVEDKASGQSLIQVFRKRTRLPIKAIKVDRDKIARMYAISPLIEAGRFFLPDSESWVPDFIDNITKFPGARHDDDVDALTQGLIELGINKSGFGNENKNLNIFGR